MEFGAVMMVGDDYPRCAGGGGVDDTTSTASFGVRIERSLSWMRRVPPRSLCCVQLRAWRYGCGRADGLDLEVPTRQESAVARREPVPMFAGAADVVQEECLPSFGEKWTSTPTPTFSSACSQKFRL
jgi:hypothetical protein